MPDVFNRYCHDLESLFYILVWTVVGMEKGRRERMAAEGRFVSADGADVGDLPGSWTAEGAALEDVREEFLIAGWDSRDHEEARRWKIEFLQVARAALEAGGEKSATTRVIDQYALTSYSQAHRLANSLLLAFAAPLLNLHTQWREHPFPAGLGRAEKQAWCAECGSAEMNIFTWEKFARILGVDEDVVKELDGGGVGWMHYFDILVEQRKVAEIR